MKLLGEYLYILCVTKEFPSIIHKNRNYEKLINFNLIILKRLFLRISN